MFSGWMPDKIGDVRSGSGVASTWHKNIILRRCLAPRLKPYKFIGLGSIQGPKPYKFIGFGSIQGPKPFKFIGFGSIQGPKPYKFIGVGGCLAPRILGGPLKGSEQPSDKPKDKASCPSGLWSSRGRGGMGEARTIL